MAVQDHDTFSGVAAWSVLQSLLLELLDAGVVHPDQLRNVLEDAASTHENAGEGDRDSEEADAAAARLIRALSAALGGTFVGGAGLPDASRPAAGPRRVARPEPAGRPARGPWSGGGT